jgi:hypothetical protein
VPSHKPLKSVAHSLAHQFASTLNYWRGDYAIHHLASAAKRENASVVVIDVLKEQAFPPEVHADVVSEIVAALKPSLAKILDKEGLSLDLLGVATLTYDFSVDRPRPLPTLPTYDCVCSLVTKEVRKYEARLTERNN